MDELQAYKEQLESLRTALSSLGDGDEATRQELETTVNDLEELIVLMESEGTSEPQEATDISTTDLDFLEELLGQRCLAPFPKNLQVSLHAAIIFECDSPIDEGEDFIVRVLYSHPLTSAMKPCKNFLKGHCNFGNSCRYSHGEPVLFSALEVYEDPDFSSIQVDSLILANTGDLWEVGRVVDIDRKHSEMAVKILQTGKDVRVIFSQVVPLHPSEMTKESSESNEIESSVGNFDSSSQFMELKGPKYGKVSVGELGDWQGGGFGLKLMQKMGYKLGEGLGKKSDGIVHAIQASVLPKNKSLDYVMENKKKIRKVDGKTAVKERINKAQRNVSGIEADIFAFINRQFEQPKSEERDEGKQMANDRRQLSEATEKALAVTVLDNEKKIKELRSKKVKLEQGLLRNKGDKKTLERLQAALDQVYREIRKAEGQQTRVQTERDSRQRKKDLF